jgi:hypothetical protein
VADGPNTHRGPGGSDGTARPPSTRIVSLRRGRIRLTPTNDNREPAERRLVRFGIAVGLVLIVAAVLVATL